MEAVMNIRFEATIKESQRAFLPSRLSSLIVPTAELFELPKCSFDTVCLFFLTQQRKKA
jgi:hypothetical protein